MSPPLIRWGIVVAADLTLVQKWLDRKREWKRLAALAEDAHVASVCEKLAQQAAEMEVFWSK